MVGFAFGDFFAAVEKTQPELTLQVNGDLLRAGAGMAESE